MKFKIKYIISSFLLVLVLLFSVFYLVERNKVYDDAYMQLEAMKYLIDCENPQKALEICSKMNYYSPTCKVVLYRNFRGSITVPDQYVCNNFTLTKEFCESIDKDLKYPHLYGNLPFQEYDNKKSFENIVKLKEECLDFVNSNYLIQ